MDSNSVDAWELKDIIANNIAGDKVTADAAIKANEVQYASYFNKAFDYTIVYPTIFDRLADQQTGAAGVTNGVILTTKDKKAQLQIAAFNNDLYPDKSSFKDTESETMGDTISYTKLIWGKGSIVMYTLVYPKR
ncbi:hypothetical protein [Clostridium sp.]|uniref:hypothetical protein n=1 Tax=Clostridium sp. TaxID=1506 RepID=UPI0026204BE0|nr:hypothetical protein [uncultured Clostridium sp.]